MIISSRLKKNRKKTRRKYINSGCFYGQTMGDFSLRFSEFSMMKYVFYNQEIFLKVHFRNHMEDESVKSGNLVARDQLGSY